ncbi:MAG: hypothetical protein FWD11_06935 [Micrococcales bacterium]|nr:hypothetical protein [Micrococcales bacterium]
MNNIYGPWRSWSATVAGVGCGAFLIVYGMVGNLRGWGSNHLEVVGVLLLIVSACYYRALLYCPVMREADLAASGDSFIRIPYGRRLFVTGIVATVAATAILTAVAVGILAEWGCSAGAVIAVVVIVLLVALFVRLGVRAAVQMSRGLAVIVDTHGIEVNSVAGSGRIDWDDIGFVTLAISATVPSYDLVISSSNSPADSQRGRFRSQPRKDRLNIELMFVDLDPLLLFAAVLSYWNSPHLRSELATGAGRRRFLDANYAQPTAGPREWDVATQGGKYRPYREPVQFS